MACASTASLADFWAGNPIFTYASSAPGVATKHTIPLMSGISLEKDQKKTRGRTERAMIRERRMRGIRRGNRKERRQSVSLRVLRRRSCTVSYRGEVREYDPFQLGISLFISQLLS